MLLLIGILGMLFVGYIIFSAIKGFTVRGSISFRLNELDRKRRKDGLTKEEKNEYETLTNAFRLGRSKYNPAGTYIPYHEPGLNDNKEEEKKKSKKNK